MFSATVAGKIVGNRGCKTMWARRVRRLSFDDGTPPKVNGVTTKLHKAMEELVLEDEGA